MCRKGLALESGKPVFLPLFPGDCNVSTEADNSTSPVMERLLQEKQGGIGPFTKDQNYEPKDSFSVESFSKDRPSSSSTSKGLGPFTKEQNLRIIERKESFKSNSFEDSGSRRSTANPWNIVDISSDGDSNSLENSDSERGRGFSGSNFFPKTPSPDPSVEASTEFLPEIREPVLQASKKETGRSLKLPEITEPILRPRSARQNSRNEVHSREKDEIQETSSSTRAFTVQFLPERLAGILAQAERYARQTLLPLISHYTPSFVTGSRYEEPKYFPPLGEITLEESRESEESESNLTGVQNDPTHETQSASNEEAIDENPSDGTLVEVPAIVEEVYPERTESNSTLIDLDAGKVHGKEERNEWVPIEPSTTLNAAISRRDFNTSRSLSWENANYNWSMTNMNSETSSLEPELDDWVPVTRNSEVPEASNNTSSEAMVDEKMDAVEVQEELEPIRRSDNGSSVTLENEEKKYIPLIDPQAIESSSIGSNDVSESRFNLSTHSHIQRIPRPVETTSEVRTSTRRSMAFPYAYERKKDPRTRYIPLIPEEDLGRSHSSIIDRER